MSLKLAFEINSCDCLSDVVVTHCSSPLLFMTELVAIFASLFMSILRR